MRPTDEQIACRDLFLDGDSMVIEAGAGTGKTSTLRLLAATSPKRGRYLAFNKSIVLDVAGKMPDRVAASTAHSLAFQAVGKRYAHRLSSSRMRSLQVARTLGVNSCTVKYGDQPKQLDAGWCASHVLAALGVFCRTVDDTPTRYHFPYVDGIDPMADDGKRTYDNNHMLAAALESALVKAWADISDTDGTLPFRHDHYLKLWQLSRPRIETDYIMFDEAQDADPVMAAVVGAQDCQVVYVGDAQQAIYEWRGAINALEGFESDHRRFLTQSFRFGAEIAAVANDVLAQLRAPLRITGTPTIDSFVGELTVEETDTILCRSNAKAITEVLNAQRRGCPVHLIGGGKEVASFARAAQALMEGRGTSHRELACFTTWGEVQDYVQNDQLGGELRLLVNLVDDFTVPVILTALEKMPSEEAADLVVSTAHKAKGREWSAVQIANDFTGIEQSDPERRLRYVAITRAQHFLDDTALHPVDDDARDVLALD